MPEPDWTYGELEDPDCSDYVIELIALHCADQAAADVRSVSVEQQAAYDRMRDVVRKRHLTNGLEAIRDPAQRSGLADHDDDGGVAERHQNASRLVGSEPGLRHYRVEIPLDGLPHE